MDKYEALDRELAILMHPMHTSIRVNGDKLWLVCNTQILPDVWVPRWTQDDGACFRMMAEHEIEFRWGVGEWPNKSVFGGCEHFSEVIVQGTEHPDKSTACRFMVVQAVLAKLKGNQ